MSFSDGPETRTERWLPELAAAKEYVEHFWGVHPVRDGAEKYQPEA